MKRNNKNAILEIQRITRVKEISFTEDQIKKAVKTINCDIWCLFNLYPKAKDLRNFIQHNL